jgi:hypothetical protein
MAANRNMCTVTLHKRRPELDTEARNEVAKHGGNPLLEDILDKMLEWKKWSDEKKPVP